MFEPAVESIRWVRCWCRVVRIGQDVNGPLLQVMLNVVDDGGAAVALYDRLGWRLVDRRLGDWTTPHGHRPLLRIYLSPTGTSAQP